MFTELVCNVRVPRLAFLKNINHILNVKPVASDYNKSALPASFVNVLNRSLWQRR